MTKRDYIIIADAISQVAGAYAKLAMQVTSGTYADGVDDALGDVANTLADSLKKDNPMFNRARFLLACQKGV